MLIIGAGPVGCELAQAFARLGTHVTLVARSGILADEDPEAAKFVLASLQADGVEIISTLEAVRTEPSIILHATGRRPNLAGLDLAVAGVEADPTHGIRVNAALKTSNPRIFAAGDVCDFGARYTHAADALARIAVQNALFPLKASTSHLLIPHCTYTDPEIASVGMTTAEGTVLTQAIEKVDLGTIAGRSGFVRMRLQPGTDRILGATVVGPAAGELISTITLCMKQKIGLKQLAGSVFPYPTYSEALRKLGDQWNRTRLTPRAKSILRTWLRWFR